MGARLLIVAALCCPPALPAQADTVRVWWNPVARFSHWQFVRGDTAARQILNAKALGHNYGYTNAVPGLYGYTPDTTIMVILPWPATDSIGPYRLAVQGYTGLPTLFPVDTSAVMFGPYTWGMAAPLWIKPRMVAPGPVMPGPILNYVVLITPPGHPWPR